MATHSSILAGEFPGQRSLDGCSPWGQKESNSTDTLTFQGLNTCLRDTGVPVLLDLLFLFCTCLGLLALKIPIELLQTPNALFYLFLLG